MCLTSIYVSPSYSLSLNREIVSFLRFKSEIMYSLKLYIMPYRFYDFI